MVSVPTFDGDMAVHLGQTAQLSPNAVAAPGEALAHVGDAISQWEDHYANARRTMDASNTVAKLSSQLNDMSFKWGKTPDRQQALDGYRADVATLKKTVVDKIDDPQVQQYVNDRFNAEASSRELETGQRAFGMESSKRVGDLDTNLTTFAQSAAGADDPLTRAKIADDGIAAIKGAVAGGWLPPEVGAEREIRFRSQLDEVTGRQAIDRAVQTQDPNDALAASKLIADPHALPGLEAETRIRLQYRVDALNDRLMSRSIAQQAHQDAVAERQLRQSQQHNETVLLMQVYGGQPVDNRMLYNLALGQRISPEGLEAVHRAQAQQGEGSDDGLTVTHLWSAIDNHHATPNDIYAAQGAGRLKGSTAAEMMRSLDRGDRTAAETAAFSTLKTAMDGQAIEDGKFGGGEAAKQAWGQAQLEWHQRVNNGEPAAKVLPDMVQRYVANLTSPIWLPRPRLGTINNAQDVNAVAAATVKAHQAHQLNDADYWQQVGVINGYKAFYTRRPGLPGGAKPGSTNAASGGPEPKP